MNRKESEEPPLVDRSASEESRPWSGILQTIICCSHGYLHRELSLLMDHAQFITEALLNFVSAVFFFGFCDQFPTIERIFVRSETKSLPVEWAHSTQLSLVIGDMRKKMLWESNCFRKFSTIAEWNNFKVRHFFKNTNHFTISSKCASRTFSRFVRFTNKPIKFASDLERGERENTEHHRNAWTIEKRTETVDC